ncbi:PQQ-binding-like beta-propeller repeat protein [Paraburkholderia sprentiae WSM5005]|uniref:PQQ-binding-like beta-propeller repeat protein n=1 Tax=Paraburkholderia sprentiae WSM5005 TaxID=754502 RepID=A0A1I9YHD2_9BURK|nr:PQQ-binding-like beta-propeller repeat protein [Paraburkholderia sprentiae]APA85715.1 PQQ-binding-like beta-propeller repeat protein [Paraburkholderia sprentiae WSM5005]
MVSMPLLLRVSLLGVAIAVAAIVAANCGGGGGGSSSAPTGTSVGAGGNGASSPSAASGGSTTSGGTTSGGAGTGPSGSGSGTSTSGTSTAAVQDVLTYHDDVARTGQDLGETTLTPANVTASTFGKVGFFSVDGKVDAQPLFVGSLAIAGGTHNVLYVATENDSVFAFDADSGAKLWQASTLGTGETPSDDLGCTQIVNVIGITSTPVIDRSRGTHGTIYVVAMSKDAAGGYHQRIHALDLATGAELLNGPTEIAASYPGHGAGNTNGVVPFTPSLYAERAALLLLGNTVYTSWTSHCDDGGYTGWIMGYGADTLQQTTVLNVTPNGIGGAIWMSGAGPASDGSSIYLLDANGTFDTTMTSNGYPANNDFGNTFLKLGTSGGLSVADYFAMTNVVHEANDDIDLGSGGALVLPDLTDASGTVRHLTLGAGKDSTIYVLNRDSMGKFNATADNIYQEIPAQLAGGEFGMPAYFNGRVYFGSVGDHLKAFTVTDAKLSITPTAQSAMTFAYPGTTPSISANGTTNGIVWAAENGTVAALHAFDPVSLNELYNSNQMGARDQFGTGNKFITPLIANGKVYVGTTNGVAVFGLLGG